MTQAVKEKETITKVKVKITLRVQYIYSEYTAYRLKIASSAYKIKYLNIQKRTNINLNNILSNINFK